MVREGREGSEARGGGEEERGGGGKGARRRGVERRREGQEARRGGEEERGGRGGAGSWEGGGAGLAVGPTTTPHPPLQAMPTCPCSAWVMRTSRLSRLTCSPSAPWSRPGKPLTRLSPVATTRPPLATTRHHSPAFGAPSPISPFAHLSLSLRHTSPRSPLSRYDFWKEKSIKWQKELNVGGRGGGGLFDDHQPRPMALTDYDQHHEAYRHHQYQSYQSPSSVHLQPAFSRPGQHPPPGANPHTTPRCWVTSC